SLFYLPRMFNRSSSAPLQSITIKTTLLSSSLNFFIFVKNVFGFFLNSLGACHTSNHYSMPRSPKSRRTARAQAGSAEALAAHERRRIMKAAIEFELRAER